jgi:hypothetical protein
MIRRLSWAVLWSVLAAGAWHYGIPIWMPFAVAGVYNTYRAFAPVRNVKSQSRVEMPLDAPLGELNRYVIDGDESFGLFLTLENERVFVDIREDQQLAARKARALELFRNANLLEMSLAQFRKANLDFSKDRRLTYIGVHAPDTQQCEVFWDPDGYTLLRGLEFVNG